MLDPPLRLTIKYFMLFFSLDHRDTQSADWTESMGIIVSRRKRREIITRQPTAEPTPEATPSQPDNQEPGTDSQEDHVVWSNDNDNESDPEEKSEERRDAESESRESSEARSDSETQSNDEGIGKDEPEGTSSCSRSSSVNSNESVSEVSGIMAKNEAQNMDDTAEVDEFTNAWSKVFLGDLDIKLSDNVKIVRIFTSSTFTGMMSL